MTAPNTTVTSRAQTLAPLLASLLVVVAISPYFEILAAQWPLRIGDVGGQFQLIGLIYAAAPQTALALALIAILGLVGGYRTMVRGVAIAAIVFAIFYLVVSPLFALDLLQVRRTINETHKGQFDLAAIKTVAFALVLAGLMIQFGRIGLRATPTPAVAGRHQRSKGEGLVVAQDGAPDER